MAQRGQLSFMDYDGFLDKFEVKRTTDDCPTPPNVYEAVKGWAVKEYGLEGREVVRPFWPGGDYESFDYPDGCVVIDNPPFSIISPICRNYRRFGIDFFLFAPYLQNFSIPARHVIAPVNVMYANGAKIPTSFVTNLGPWEVHGAPDLAALVEEADKANRETKNAKRKLPRVIWPREVLKASDVGYFVSHGIGFKMRPEECRFTPELAARKPFGGCYLVAERARAEAERARAEAERARTEEVKLSDIERLAVEELDWANREDSE